MRLNSDSPRWGKRQTILVAAAGVLAAVLLWRLLLGGADGQAGSDDPQVRAQVAEELGQKGKPSKTLYQLAEDPAPEVAITAIRNIRDTGDPGRNEEVRGLLQRVMEDGARDPVIRGAAAGQLGSIPGVTVETLTQRMSAQADPPEVRAGAALGLQRLQDPQALPHLVKALRDPSAEVRARAISAISAISLIHFPFDAAKPASEQGAEIRLIEQKLRSRGLLR